MKFIELKANIQLAAKLNMDYSYFTYLIYKRSDDQNYIPYIIPKKVVITAKLQPLARH